jgi:uncharacterized peroxidase-related enzyme
MPVYGRLYLVGFVHLEEPHMSRIPTPATIADAPAAAQANLQAVEKKLGSVPNMFRLIATSPAALEGYLAMSAALAKGSINAALGERIALAVAEVNACDYCLSAHSYLAKNLARLDDSEIAANRSGASHDVKADAAVRFAAEVTRQRGHVSEAALNAARGAGWSDAALIEIVQHVALNCWTNFFNETFKTDIDFPVVAARKSA